MIVLVMVTGAAVPGWSQSASKLGELVIDEGPVAEGEADLDTDKKVKRKPTAEIYGFVQTDVGYNFGRIDPNWFDVVRPSKLPAYENQFGEDGDA